METLNNTNLNIDTNKVKKTNTLTLLNRKKPTVNNTKKVNNKQSVKVVDEKKVDLRKIHKFLFETHSVLREFKPLTIKDIVVQIFEFHKENPQISKTSLRRFLNYHVNSLNYLKNIVSQDKRYNLDGSIADGKNGVITKEAKTYSQEKVLVLEQKLEERKKAIALKKAAQQKKKFNNNFNNKKKFNNNNKFNNNTNGYKKPFVKKDNNNENKPKIYTKSTFKNNNYVYKNSSNLKNTASKFNK